MAFETALSTAQIHDAQAGRLTARKAKGGPENLANQEFYLGINDLFGDSKTGGPFDPIVFNIYDAWKSSAGTAENRARAAVARSKELFNTKLIRISDVSEINEKAAFGNPAFVNGSCTTCHDTPNSGSHSVAAPLNIGLADQHASRVGGHFDLSRVLVA